MIKRQYSISYYFDIRRKLLKGKYPIKLRVYANQIKKKKLYSTKFEFTENEFKKIWLSKRQTNEKYKTLRLQLQALENKANEIASNLEIFSFEQFEKKMFLKKGDTQNVYAHFKTIIDNNIALGRIGNANVYSQSMKSIKDFINYTTGKESIQLNFIDIGVHWLKSYEKYMLDKNKSRTTISIYLRALRSVFNSAIQDQDILNEIYPFGNRKYQIPKSRNIKKALNKIQLKTLNEASPLTLEQEKAKDFFFFSYYNKGMNISDIANLKYKNIHEDKLIYERGKTKNTSGEVKPIMTYLNEFSILIINKYGNKNKNPENLIFSIISKYQNDIEKLRSIKAFTRFINQHIKLLAISVGLPQTISSYWARHSFATNAIHNGATIDMISEALNHSDIRVTQNYINSFPEGEKKELWENLTRF